MTEIIPFPIFLLIAALSIDAALAFVWLILREVAPRWNGMSLEWKINIYKSEGGA